MSRWKTAGPLGQPKWHNPEFVQHYRVTKAALSCEMSPSGSARNQMQDAELRSILFCRVGPTGYRCIVGEKYLAYTAFHSRVRNRFQACETHYCAQVACARHVLRAINTQFTHKNKGWTRGISQYLCTIMRFTSLETLAHSRLKRCVSDSIQYPVVHAKVVGPVLLPDHYNRARPWRAGQPDDSILLHVLQWFCHFLVDSKCHPPGGCFMGLLPPVLISMRTRFFFTLTLLQAKDIVVVSQKLFEYF